MKFVLVLTTTSSEEQAGALARSIVEAELAACVHLQPIRSMYRWKDTVCDEAEWRLAIKTTAERYEALERHIKERHSYQMPEIVRIEIAGGSTEYLRWIDENVGSGTS